MEISKAIRYVGVNDHQVDLFEGQYKVSNGMAYNSYVILDEKIAVLDTIEVHFKDEWLANIEKVLAGKKPDYLVVHHMEPDHSANIKVFMDAYPEAKIVSSAMAFGMMKQFFGDAFEDRQVVVQEGSTLELGSHTLHFVGAPMVHWPEVLMSYESSEKVLFSADGFGKFGANDVKEDWDDESRRYYIGIVGKYGPQVQVVLKKVATLDIQTICPLHGPVLKENLGHYLDLYNKWSSYAVEKEGVVICYTSVYGHTKEAVNLLERILKVAGTPTVVYDLARCDMAQAVADCFSYGKIVLASTTYNTSVFPPMHTFLTNLAERNFQNRKVAFIENGTWSPNAANVMHDLLKECKNLDFEPTITIRSALNSDNKNQIVALAKSFEK